MKLTTLQKQSILILREDKSLPKDSSKLNKLTMNSLYFKNLVKLTSCANGEFWELTNYGLTIQFE